MLVIKPRALYMLGKLSTTELRPQPIINPFLFFFAILGLELWAYLSHFTSPFFVKGFFEIGSRKVFAWVWL
jgi:hypothetical protein